MTVHDVATSQEFRQVLLSSDVVHSWNGRTVANMRFPDNVNCFLIDDVQFEAVAISLDDAAKSSGRRAVCCDLRLLSSHADSIIGNHTDVTLVAAGAGALDLACAWDRVIVQQEIECVLDSRHRERRKIQASEVVSPGPVVLFDDVAVSGVTLSSAVAAIRTAGRIEVLVGMAFASKEMRARVHRAGAHVFNEVVRYSRAGGGRTPINTLSTLRKITKTRRDLAMRYFGGPYALDFLALTGDADA